MPQLFIEDISSTFHLCRLFRTALPSSSVSHCDGAFDVLLQISVFTFSRLPRQTSAQELIAFSVLWRYTYFDKQLIIQASSQLLSLHCEKSSCKDLCKMFFCSSCKLSITSTVPALVQSSFVPHSCSDIHFFKFPFQILCSFRAASARVHCLFPILRLVQRPVPTSSKIRRSYYTLLTGL